MPTVSELDTAYQDGIDDLGSKILNLIWDTDYTLDLDTLERFVEAEMGMREDEDEDDDG